MPETDPLGLAHSSQRDSSQFAAGFVMGAGVGSSLVVLITGFLLWLAGRLP
jgi:hypothetical protein